MNRSMYATNSSFYNQDNLQPEDRQPEDRQPEDRQPEDRQAGFGSPGVIRPPIREAYDTQQEYERAVVIGRNYAHQHNIQYIGNY